MAYKFTSVHSTDVTQDAPVCHLGVAAPARSVFQCALAEPTPLQPSWLRQTVVLLSGRPRFDLTLLVGRARATGREAAAHPVRP
jgi:hypothetical protein